jgi:hypothetical protein
MTDEDAVKFAAEELQKIGVIDADAVLDSHRELIKKAYPAYFDTYAEIDKLIEYLNTFENLWCVGRNGQHRYNNMDHSMATSFEAVRGILAGSTDKTAVWNVNTEKSYHEEKSAEVNEEMAPTPASEDFHDVTVKKIPKKEYKPPISIEIGKKKSSQNDKKD